ncbi:MAG TPA: ATP-binding protein [Chthoniobacterales bacterium]
MIAKRIPSILPPLTLAEATATTKVHSVCDLLAGNEAFVWDRPFRAPATPSWMPGCLAVYRPARRGEPRFRLSGNGHRERNLRTGR